AAAAAAAGPPPAKVPKLQVSQQKHAAAAAAAPISKPAAKPASHYLPTRVSKWDRPTALVQRQVDPLCQMNRSAVYDYCNDYRRSQPSSGPVNYTRPAGYTPPPYDARDYDMRPAIDQQCSERPRQDEYYDKTP
ncbi:hypothetical protein PFISCL1PPCAC_9148, partial [Pristionchus fissidentatus]